MKSIYATGSLQDAELLRILLRQNGIDSILENEFSHNVALGAASLPLLVTVSDEDEAGAVHVVRKHVARFEKPR